MIGKKKIIAVCVAKIQDDATNDYITALNDVVSGVGYGVLVYNANTIEDTVSCYDDARLYIYGLMDFSVIDVVIIHEETIQNETVIRAITQYAKNSDIPVIIIGERREGCINIKFDKEYGFEAMVRHMIETHHMTDLHMMAGTKNNPFSENRLEVFKRVLVEYNLPFDDSMVSYGDFWSDPAEAATEKLVASGKLPQAILCANDKMAIAVCGVLIRHGIKVPEQIAVTGFDGILEINFSSPKITTARCEAMDIAKKTLEVLVTVGKYKDKTESFLVPVRLSFAETCGCIGKVPVDASRYLNILNDRFYLYQNEAIRLSAIMTRIERCESLGQITEELRDGLFYDMCCVMEKNFSEEERNPEEFRRELLNDKSRDTILLYDCNVFGNLQERPFPLKQIIPNIVYCMETGRAVVLTPLQHIGVPMGYAGFFFARLDHVQSSRITQITNSLSVALGDYRNMRYKNFLMHQIDEMYRIDALTGLYNRRGFALAYQKLLETEGAASLPLTIVLADLDRLKYINDTFGHKEGDFAIRSVAEALKEVCPKGSIFNRFGGDEMLAVCQGRYDPEPIRNAFTRYFKKFNEESQKPYDVHASIGVYITEENEQLDFEEILERSDRLMYAEKERHRKKLANK